MVTLGFHGARPENFLSAFTADFCFPYQDDFVPFRGSTAASASKSMKSEIHADRVVHRGLVGEQKVIGPNSADAMPPFSVSRRPRSIFRRDIARGKPREFISSPVSVSSDFRDFL